MSRDELFPQTKGFLPMNLQFFAEEGSEDSGASDDSKEGAEDKGEDGNTGDQNQEKSGEQKTFTQAELNKMMKAEKESGKRAILKALGITDEKAGKDALAKYQEYLDSQKSEAEKKDEKLTALASEKTAAEQKAQYLENKFVAIAEGVKLDAVDDVVTLATLKVTDDKDLKTVISEMKDKYPGFFVDGEEDTHTSRGTGTGINSSRKDGKQEGIGSRLATASKSTQTKKSSYFSR